MDPADIETLHQALAMQGLLNWQHDQSLKEIVNSLKTSLPSSVLFKNNYPSPAPTIALSPSPSSPLSHHDPFIPAPDRYDGDLGSYHSFVAKLLL